MLKTTLLLLSFSWFGGEPGPDSDSHSDLSQSFRQWLVWNHLNVPPLTCLLLGIPTPGCPLMWSLLRCGLRALKQVTQERES